MRNKNLLNTSLGKPPAPQIELSDEDDGFDPYQEYYNFLVGSGVASDTAWDTVWANPALALDIGWKLAELPVSDKAMAFAA